MFVYSTSQLTYISRYILPVPRHDPRDYECHQYLADWYGHHGESYIDRYFVYMDMVTSDPQYP